MILLSLNKAGNMLKSYFLSPSKEVKLKQPSKIQISILCALLISVLILSLKDYNSFQLGTYVDDASYAVLAQSIAFSDSYGLMNFPGEPLPTRYPFGFPLLLSPLARLFPQEPDALKTVSLIATLLNTALLFIEWPTLSQNKSHWWGLIIAALYSLSPLVIGHTRMVMSEPAFTAFALLSLVMCEKYAAHKQSKPLGMVLLGVAVVFTSFIRTIGVALLLAVVVRILML